LRPCRIAAVLLALIVGLAGCETVDDAVDDVRREADKRIAQGKEKGGELRREAVRLRDRVSDRVNEVLADIEGVVPQADEATVIPQRVAASSFEGFMNDVFVNIDGYWKETFAAADIARPRVGRVSSARARRSTTTAARTPTTSPRSTAPPTTRSMSASQSAATSSTTSATSALRT